MKPAEKWLSGQARLAGRSLGAASALGVAGGLLIVAQAAVLVRVADGVLFRHEGLAVLGGLLWLLLAAFAARAVVAWAAERSAFRCAARVKLDVRRRLYARVQRLGPVFLYGEKSGEIAGTLVEGVEALGDYYARYLPQRAVAAVLPLAMLAFIYPLDWVSGVVMTAMAAAVPFLMYVVGGTAETLSSRQWRKLARLSARFVDSLQGLGTLKVFGASRREIEVIATLSEDYRKTSMGVMQVAFVSALILELFSTISIAAVAILIGTRLLLGSMSFQPGYFILLLAPEYYLPLRVLGTYYHRRIDAVSAAERIVELLQTEAPPRPVSSRRLPAQEAVSLEVEEARFAYAPDRPALEGVSFRLPAGETLGIVGPSGAGKSTIVNLLLGFVRPDSGVVRVNGRDLWSLDLEEWLQLVAWMPQRPHLFHGTVLDNIRLGRPEASEDEVREAARRARADRFVRELPQGYLTRLGEGGAGLSGGQAQRVALSRAFLKDAPLVILDEVAANMDSQSERLVQAGIAELRSGRTVISVAHRLSTLAAVGRLLVLDRGRVVQEGSPPELAGKPGLYREMVAAYAGDA